MNDEARVMTHKTIDTWNAVVAALLKNRVQRLSAFEIRWIYRMNPTMISGGELTPRQIEILNTIAPRAG